MKASELREKARGSLKGNYWYAVLATFIAGIFGANASGSTFSINIDMDVLEVIFGDVPSVIIILLMILGLGASVLSFVRLILGGVIQLGYVKFLVKQHDREVHSIKDLFSQMDRFGQGFLQFFLRGLFVFLWSLLFVIPGIIKSYSYAMTPYIMADNPEMTANEAITASKQLMDGHKWELFCLGFSFIGWHLLALLTFGIGMFFLVPYVESAYVAFYRDKIAPKTAITTEAYTVPQISAEM